MKNILLLAWLIIFCDLASAVCSSPISRTNYSSGQVLTSTSLNNQLNAVYARANELPGDCIADDSINSSKIDDGTIVNADVSASAAIASSKIALNYSVSNSSSTFATSSGTYVDVTNLTTSVTASGKPVEIYLIPDGGNVSYLNATSSAALAAGRVKLLRGATTIGELRLSSGATGSTTTETMIPSSAFRFLDVPASGSHTYKLQAMVEDPSYSLEVFYAKLVVREL